MATKEPDLAAAILQLESAIDDELLESPDDRSDALGEQLEGILNLFIVMLGFLALAGGIAGVLVALSMDPTVEASHIDDNRLRQTERVYNQGLMHTREVRLIVSSASVIAGVLILGLNAIRMGAIRTAAAIEELSATLDPQL